MAGPDREGALARWSRRKQAARHGRPEDEPGAAEAPAAVPAEEVAPPQPETEGGPAPELPDPDTLDDPGAFKAFMAKGVPPELRRRALRRLWRLDPIYSHHDGLDDFCGDYTDQARVVPNLKTAYRVGRGFLDRVARADPPLPAAGRGPEGARAAADPAPDASDRAVPEPDPPPAARTSPEPAPADPTLPGSDAPHDPTPERS
jgi:hypothetical protein